PTTPLLHLDRGPPLHHHDQHAAVVELGRNTGVPVPTLRTVHAISDLLALRSAA
ncbi:oxidoreductase, partial [Streptomyces sp. NPDC059378]